MIFLNFSVGIADNSAVFVGSAGNSAVFVGSAGSSAAFVGSRLSLLVPTVSSECHTVSSECHAVSSECRTPPPRSATPPRSAPIWTIVFAYRTSRHSAARVMSRRPARVRRLALAQQPGRADCKRRTPHTASVVVKWKTFRNKGRWMKTCRELLVVDAGIPQKTALFLDFH